MEITTKNADEAHGILLDLEGDVVHIRANHYCCGQGMVMVSQEDFEGLVYITRAIRRVDQSIEVRGWWLRSGTWPEVVFSHHDFTLLERRSDVRERIVAFVNEVLNPTG